VDGLKTSMETTADGKIPEKTERLLSLDALRGFDMFFITGVGQRV